MDITLSTGFEQHERRAVATLYWQAFGHKLGRALGPTPRALRFLDRVIDPDFALVARDPDGGLLGVAGFKTADGALVGGDYSDLQAIYGHWGAIWRGAVLSVVERDLAPDILLMDGICVAESARGGGVGTALLDAMKAKTRALGKRALRLDVIDTNPRARALYLRQGFVPQNVETTGPFRIVFRFRSATQMVWEQAATGPASPQRSELTRV